MKQYSRDTGIRSQWLILNKFELAWYSKCRSSRQYTDCPSHKIQKPETLRTARHSETSTWRMLNCGEWRIVGTAIVYGDILLAIVDYADEESVWGSDGSGQLDTGRCRFAILSWMIFDTNSVPKITPRSWSFNKFMKATKYWLESRTSVDILKRTRLLIFRICYCRYNAKQTTIVLRDSADLSPLDLFSWVSMYSLVGVLVSILVVEQTCGIVLWDSADLSPLDLLVFHCIH